MSAFEEHMDKAIDQLEQAVSSITYPASLNINSEEIGLLNETVDLLGRLKTMTIK